VNVGEQVQGNGGSKKGKGKGNRAQSPAPSNATTSTVNQDTRYKEPELRGRPIEAPPARSRNDVPMPPRDEGRRGNQYPRFSSADSQFWQPLQERDQQVQGPRWNTGIPSGAVDRRP